MTNCKWRRAISANLMLFVFLFSGPNSWAGPYADPTYVPAFVDDMEVEGAAGDTWYVRGEGRSTYDLGQANSGARSVKISFADEKNYFGGSHDLPTSVKSGETVWYRLYLYIPSTTSFSSSGTGDYSGWGKFLVMSKANHNPPRMYAQIPAPSQKNFGDAGFHGAGLRIDSDGMGTCNFSSSSLPRDKWFSLQMAWKLSPTDGLVRLWLDENYVGGCNSTIGSDFQMRTWGIGTYWNGGAWIKGSSTAHFWVDDIVVTTETPNTTDAGGRPFIHPRHFSNPVVRPKSPVLD